MGTKADKRAHRLAAALDREWWKAWADAWFWIGERQRYQTDVRYRARVDAENGNRMRARALVGSLTEYEGEYTIEIFTPEFVAHLDTGESGQLCLPLWELAWMCGVRAWETHTGDVVTSKHARYDVRPGRPYRQSWESALVDTKSTLKTQAKLISVLGLGSPVVL